MFCPHFDRELDFPTECSLCSGLEARRKAEDEATEQWARDVSKRKEA